MLPGLASVPVATFPQVIASATTALAGGGAAKSANLPSGIVAGMMLVVVAATNGDENYSTPAGWTKLFEKKNGTGSQDRNVGVFTRIADGTEGSSMGAIASSSAGLAAIALTIGGSRGAEVNATGVSASSGTAVNPPSLTLSGGAAPALWMAVAACRSTSFSAFPPGYTGLSANNSNMIVGLAYKTLQAATEDPGNFTQASSDSQACTTLAFLPT